MNSVKFVLAETDSHLKEIALLAEEIWHQHFTDIIGEDQVNYMVEKFQSYPALKKQIKNGYEYYQICSENALAGYTGVHQEDETLFLSKLYIHENFRGTHLATKTFHFLVELCKERKLKSIWLTCNRHNSNTLAVYDHLGFQITREQVSDIGNGYVMDDYILEYVVKNYY